MKKQTYIIKRFSSFTILKLIFIATILPSVLIDTGVILYHLLSGDFVVNYNSVSEIIKSNQSGSSVETETVEGQISLVKYVLISYPFLLLFFGFFSLLMWVQWVVTLWLWSLFRPMKVSFYSEENKEI